MRARLGSCVLASALLLAACGDDGDDSSEGDDELVTDVDVDGCEPGEISGGDDPGDAPDMPDDPKVALEDAMAKTKNLSSAVTAFEIEVDAPQMNTLVDMETAFADDGVVRAVAQQGVNDDNATVVFCSDGETGWLHLDYPTVADALPDDAAWVDGPSAEMFETGLIRDPKTTWDIFAILRGLTDVEDDGTEHVSDAQVRLIKGKVDYEAALAASSEEEARAMSTVVTAASDADITAVAGLDGDGVLRWLELDIEGRPASASEDEAGEAGEAGEDEGGEDEADEDTVKARYQVEVRDANPSIKAPRKPPEDDSVRLADVPEVERLIRGQG